VRGNWGGGANGVRFWTCWPCPLYCPTSPWVMPRFLSWGLGRDEQMYPSAESHPVAQPHLWVLPLQGCPSAPPLGALLTAHSLCLVTLALSLASPAPPGRSLP
jgi:hypothetical protein